MLYCSSPHPLLPTQGHWSIRHPFFSHIISFSFLLDFPISINSVISSMSPKSFLILPFSVVPILFHFSHSSKSLFFFFFYLFAFSRAAPAAYGGFQSRGPIGAIATDLSQSHSNAGSEPCLQPTAQLTATLDP